MACFIMNRQQNLTSLGYKRQLNWAKDNAAHDADRVFCCPLFSVTDQERMSRMIGGSLGQQSTSAVLAKLDFENGSDERAGDFQILLLQSTDVNADESASQSTSLSLTPVPSPALSGSKRIPPLAPKLLRYFKENIVSFSFPLKNCRNCPWQAFHLPGAMSTFAKLSIHQPASHTRLSLFSPF
ncbi:hypothetical protein BBP40_002269 [Aspergillus hancockii]|nr:hypothetical protein BBP40_002269 [Aspergillus hancockii]